MKRAIISVDTDRIKEYVFATATLKEIRGASGILDELNRKKMERVIRAVDPTAQKIYANGGSGMFEVDEAKAALCIQEVENLYTENTVTGSISGAFQLSGSSVSFKDIIKILNYKLRMVKDSGKAIGKPITHPFLRTCDSCGNEYAGYQTGDEKVLCLSCQKKREKDRKIKDNIEAVLSGRRAIPPLAERCEIWDRLLPELMTSEGYDIKGKERPDDFNKIGELSSPSGYMGLIYADGDRMGDKLDQLQSDKEVKEFSETVDDAIFKSVLTAIQEHLRPKDYSPYFPFDVLMLGGDDLVMVTPAEKAIPTAISIMDAFEKITKCYAMNRFGKPLTVSVGVAIAHAKFPIGQFLKLAEDILKSAKKKGKGQISFQVVSASSALSYEKVLTRTVNKPIAEPKKFIRTLRPFNTQRLKALTEKIQHLKQNSFPRSKLQALREAAFLDFGNSILAGLTTYIRLKTKQREDVLKLLESVIDDGFPVWFKQEGIYYTPFVDVAELYDFIPGGES